MPFFAPLLGVLLVLPSLAPATLQPLVRPFQTERPAMHEANGSFTVKMTPLTTNPDPTIQAWTLTKTWQGALEGTSTGEMLGSGDPGSGNAGYVAIERVTGTLDGKQGTFALMHSGRMTKGSPAQLTVSIVPGSGTGALSGIYGDLTISVAADGAHTYTLRYAFSVL